MRAWAKTLLALIVITLSLTGCSDAEQPSDGGPSVTWEEAKAAAQAKTLEVVALIPSDDVVAVDQHETGSLFSCDDKRHRWTGVTYIALRPGVDAESVTKMMEGKVEELFPGNSDFTLTTHRGITDNYVVTVKSQTTHEAYLFGEGEPGTIAIDAWSVCFTLPEGTYPGGSF